MPEIMVRFDDLRRYCENHHRESIPLEYIKQMPTIEAEPVKHAKWESWGYVFHGIEWKRCSACNKCAGVSYYGMLDGKIEMETPAVCGCCGARMDGGAENG